VIAGATITAMDLFENNSFAATSDAFGDFWIRNLKPKRKYRIDIAKDGHEPVRTIITTDGDQDMGTIVLKRGR